MCFDKTKLFEVLNKDILCNCDPSETKLRHQALAYKISRLNTQSKKMKPSKTKESFIYLFYSVLGKGNELHTSSFGLSIGKVARRSYLRRSIHLCPSKKSEYLLCFSISSVNAACVTAPL